MTESGVLCLDAVGYHRMHYYEWGDADNPRVVICVHGLTRNGRDFDFLAEHLRADFRVVCPDIAGRGKSDWLAAKRDYGYPQYVADLTALFARVTRSADQRVSWVGTSMGGLLGMVIAARPGNPIEKLVVNDAGMVVPKAALERLAGYVGKEPLFPTLDALEAHTRTISAPFGPLTDAQWRHLTLYGAKQHADGAWGVRYDPAIATAFEGELADIDLTAYWDAIACPALLLRGADSDILPRETAEAMTRRGPKARLVEFQGMGHAPMLMCDEQVEAVRDFLLES
jgi:pimeloyl-ACP methyl ester carboxylesterase